MKIPLDLDLDKQLYNRLHSLSDFTDKEPSDLAVKCLEKGIKEFEQEQGLLVSEVTDFEYIQK